MLIKHVPQWHLHHLLHESDETVTTMKFYARKWPHKHQLHHLHHHRSLQPLTTNTTKYVIDNNTLIKLYVPPLLAILDLIFSYVGNWMATWLIPANEGTNQTMPLFQTNKISWQKERSMKIFFVELNDVESMF